MKIQGSALANIFIEKETLISAMLEHTSIYQYSPFLGRLSLQLQKRVPNRNQDVWN